MFAEQVHFMTTEAEPDRNDDASWARVSFVTRGQEEGSASMPLATFGANTPAVPMLANLSMLHAWLAAACDANTGA